MDRSYRKLTPVIRKCNCIRIYLLLFNILYLVPSLVTIVLGVLHHLFIMAMRSFILEYGFSLKKYLPVLYIYGAILLVISCIGITVACRHSYRLTKFYTQLLSAVTVVETVAGILAVPLYPFMERHVWNVMQYTINQCDDKSVGRRAMNAILYVQKTYKCCGLNDPDSMTNETKIVTGCQEKIKYEIYNNSCQLYNHYRVNCFDQIYSDLYDKLFTILIYLVIAIALQGLAIYCSVLHGLNIQKERDTAIELSKIDDYVVTKSI